MDHIRYPEFLHILLTELTPKKTIKILDAHTWPNSTVLSQTQFSIARLVPNFHHKWKDMKLWTGNNGQILFKNIKWCTPSKKNPWFLVLVFLIAQKKLWFTLYPNKDRQWYNLFWKKINNSVPEVAILWCWWGKMLKFFRTSPFSSFHPQKNSKAFHSYSFKKVGKL